MYKTFFVLFLFIFGGLVIYPQKVEGTIKDSFGTIIPRASIIIKTEKSSSAISEFFIANSQGNFSFDLKKTYNNTIFLEVSTLNFKKAIDSISNPEIDVIYSFDFILTHNTTELEEVIISQRKKFDIKKDTVVFNPEAYKDGTERKIEDLIKKLPGMEVEENGTIKYRGKSVQALMLDGDDLFGYNYSIGTKNISIDMVDQIEAIENYSKNPLLSGIENSDNVALNLKLKKGKIDYSGTGSLGYGYGDKPYYDLSANVLGINKFFKSFATFSFNTVGINNTPFDYFSNSVSLEDINNEPLYAHNIINDTPLSSILSNSRTRLNKEWFGNYNFIYRFSPKFSVKSNIFYVTDEFFRQELYQNDFFTSSETISYSDRTKIIKKPEKKRLDLKFTYNASKKSLLEIETSIEKENIISQNTLTRNLDTTFATLLRSDIFFLKNKLEFTNKLSKNSALQFVSLYSRNNKPQYFNTFGNFFSPDSTNNPYSQVSEYRKETFQNVLILLGKRKTLKYALNAGTKYFDSPFRSSLIENEVEVFESKNNFEYIKINYFTSLALGYSNKQLKLESSVGFNYIDQSLNSSLQDTISQENEGSYFEYSFKTQYQINPVSKLTFNGSLEQRTPEENYLFENGVITDNRSIRNNIPNLNLGKYQKYLLNYKLDDLFKNIEANLIVGYNNKKNTYIPNININSNFTETTYFQSPLHLDDWFFNVSLERYLRFIRTDFKFSSQYSISNIKNIVNQSNLRNGQSHNYKGNLFTKTAFNSPINFENNITYGLSSYSVENQPTNTNFLIKNSFKTIIKPYKNWLVVFTYDYFKPNTENKQDFSFLDFNIQYKPKNLKWISGSLIGKNLLDNTVFEQVENSDFFTISYQSNLIPRYFMLLLNISF